MASIVRNVVNWSAQHSHAARPPPIQRDMCEVCGKNPKFVEKGYKHPYCGRKCAAASNATQRPRTIVSGLGFGSSGQSSNSIQRRVAAQSSSSSSGSSNTTPTKTIQPTPTSFAQNQATAGVNNCTFSGCNFGVEYYGYCGPEHAMEAVKSGQVEACDVCQEQPWVYLGPNSSKTGGKNKVKLCPGCDRVAKGGAQIKELGSRDGKFQQVRKQFIKEWNTRNEGLPTVDKVYQVILPREEVSQYQSYRRALKNPREIRTYHASIVVCDLGTKGPFLCERKGCGVCSVVRSSFKEFAFEEEFNQGRFGPGIYTYMNPKLADKYATTVTSSPYRVMVQCDVLLDVQQQVPTDESVFVGSSDAINAAYIVMYSM